MKQHLPPPLPFLRELKITETVYEHDLQLDLGHIVARIGTLESEVSTDCSDRCALRQHALAHLKP